MASDDIDLIKLRARARARADEVSALQQIQAPNTLDYDKLTYSPTIGMGGPERVVAGAQKAGSDVFMAARQALPSFMGGASVEDVQEKRRLDAPLSETPGGQAGEIIGNAAMALPFSMAPGANTVLGAAAYGGLFGALQPAESLGERAKNIAASGLLSGGITGAVNRGAPLAVGAYKGVVSPFTQKGQEGIAVDAIQRFAHDKTALSRVNPTELIPGSKPTLAEVTGDPGIAQLQRAAVAASPETASIMSAHKTARAQARKDAIAGISGTHDDREFFEAARDATASRLYKDAFKSPINPKRLAKAQPAIDELMTKPSIQNARAEAIKRAKEDGIDLTDADVNGGSLQGLHWMKRAIDSQISEAKTKGDADLVRLLTKTQNQMVGVMQQISPKYARAMAQYEADSKPINQMEIGKYLYEKLIPALSDLGAERMTPAQYARALADGDEMAKKATGFKGAKLADILTTDQMNTLINLGLDLGRDAGAVSRGMVPGSQTAQYLAGGNLLRQVMGPMGLPESWGEGLVAKTIGGRGLSAIVAPVENKVQQTLARFLVSPEDAKKAAEALSRANAKVTRIGDLIKNKYLPPVSLTAGGVYAGQQ